ncbi:MAG: hypothetical protein ACLU9R_02780 [Faecalibacterium sp.]
MKQLKITKFPALDYAGNEAFNTLSTNLSFAGASVKKIMITSCHASEGKSYLSMNLMRTWHSAASRWRWWTQTCAAAWSTVTTA